MQICADCGGENSDRARFCQACASPLGLVSGPSREVRKTVTVLFSDVAGFTPLGERLDPESVRRVMSRYFDRSRAILKRHGGTVEKFIGDAVMAVFGFPSLHDDDALRACRAAMEMQDELSLLNGELESDWGVRIQTRTGVNTGEVVAGDASEEPGLITGDAVNTAARLEQAASPGEVLIGETTHKLVHDAVKAESVAPLSLKGKAVPVTAFRLLEVVSADEPHPLRLRSPMVGRDTELELLQGAFERAVAERRPVLATVVGMPGVGKSRLAHELITELSDGPTVLQGRCLPYGDGLTFWPMVAVVRQAAGFTENESPQEAASRIQALLPPTEDREAIRDRVASAVGLAGAGGVMQETYWAIRKLLEAVAADRPLIAVFDDLQWGEPAFLDLLEYLEGWSRDAPILILCLARPELLETRPGWGAAASRSVTLGLEPLTDEQSERLVHHLLGQAELPEELRRHIAQRAEGNPLFVEEMLSMLVDEGFIRRDGDSWAVATDLREFPVPPSIQALLATRLDALAPGERETIERASVVGEVFYWGAVSALSPESSRAELGGRLMGLVRRQFIRPAPSDFAHEDAYRFRHILIRDAAYRGLPKSSRAQLHERFADWLGEVAGDRTTEYEEILGYHLEQSFRYRRELHPDGPRTRDLAARASALLASSGRQASARSDVNAAVSLLSRAASLVPSDDSARPELLLELGAALRTAQQLPEAGQVLADALERARATGDRRIEWRAIIEQLWLEGEVTAKARMDEEQRTVERAIAVFEDLGDELGLARCFSLMGFLLFNAGRAAAAQETVELAAHHARLAGDQVQEVWCLVPLSMYAAVGPMAAADAIDLCRGILRRIQGNRSAEARVLQETARLQAMRGDFDEARAAVAESRTVMEDLGLRGMLAATSDAAADVELLAGNLQGAEGELRSGYAIYKEIDAKDYVATWAASLARVTCAQGRDEEAMEFTRISEELASADDVTAQVPWRATRGKVLARRGALAEGEQLIREAVAIAEKTDWLWLLADALMDRAEVNLAAGEPRQAVNAVERALELYERKGIVPSAARASALLETLTTKADP